MNLETLLAEKKKAVVRKWIDQVLESYGSPEFFKKQKDRFANPIGSTISDGLAKLYAALVENKNLDDITASLEALDARIDKLALMAFDIYMNCRERLHQIRVNEVLSGRSALTDGTKCISAMLKSNQTELADNKQNNRLT